MELLIYLLACVAFSVFLQIVNIGIKAEVVCFDSKDMHWLHAVLVVCHVSCIKENVFLDLNWPTADRQQPATLLCHGQPPPPLRDSSQTSHRRLGQGCLIPRDLGASLFSVWNQRDWFVARSAEMELAVNTSWQIQASLGVRPCVRGWSLCPSVHALLVYPWVCASQSHVTHWAQQKAYAAQLRQLNQHEDR